MIYFRWALWILLLTGSLVSAQTSTPDSQSKKPPASVDPELQQRRSVALSALQSLAIDARSYRDEPLRALVQARIADALWEQDQEGSRALFRRAWDLAEELEKHPASRAPMPGRAPAGRTPPRASANLRREILQLVAKRDRKLGEEFLKRMTPKDEARNDSNATSGTSNLSAAEIAERLRLANSFLAEGNVSRALEFADPAMSQVSTGTVGFLIALYEKDAAAADQRFAALLTLAVADPSSDANTVSLLTSYAFTPSIFFVVSPGGIPSSNSFPSHPPPNLSAALRKLFFQTAANILLRPLAQIEQSSAGRSGTYFMVTRLLPLFQQFAPDLAPALSAQLSALGPDAGRATAEYGDRAVNRGMNGDGQLPAFEDELKDRLDRARTSDERDRAYAFAAMAAAGRGDARAHDYVDKIEDTDTRSGIRKFVDYSFIRSLLQKKRADDALVLLRKGDLPHSVRAHVLTEAAGLLNDKDRVRANDLLEEALIESRRIDAGSADRAYCLVALLAQFSKTNKARVWELLGETVKAANNVAEFTGENGQTTLTLEGKFSIQMMTQLCAPEDLAQVFAGLSEADFYQALDAARNFSGDAPRAVAMISVGRKMFEQKRAEPPLPTGNNRSPGKQPLPQP
ncbi:MAG TPA: hypothetical protein VE961_24565 [Pyrinomonadaceae bacterium]|nr:hypothetical protein [Pyrinomonadaceae bacterium]